MSAEHFPAGRFPHQPNRSLDDELYGGVERDVVYACTDVALRDAETGRIFLGDRQTDPQIGPWFIGGRNRYGEGIQANAALQVRSDLRLDLDPERFFHVGTYSTPFPIAGPGREEHGRHTQNATMCIDLKPEEVEELNRKVAAGEVRDEYTGGRWYEPQEIAQPHSDFAGVVKQFARDLTRHDLMYDVMRDQANAENAAFDAEAARQKREEVKRARVTEVTENTDLTNEEAEELEAVAGPYSLKATRWAEEATEELTVDVGKGSAELQLRQELESLLSDKDLGDAQIKRRLTALGITPPRVMSENGPALRKTLGGALKVLSIREPVVKK